MSKTYAAIRAAKITDATMLCQVIRKAFEDVAERFGLNASNCPKHPSNYTVEWVENDFARGVRYYLLEVDNQALGCAAIEVIDDNLCYLERVAVRPLDRKNGYGKRLVTHLLAIARSQGIKHVSIGIIADQTELKQWYRNIGFEEGETKTYQHLPFKVTFMTFLTA